MRQVRCPIQLRAPFLLHARPTITCAGGSTASIDFTQLTIAASTSGPDDHPDRDREQLDYELID
jgi:hypothetical protein